VADARVSSTGEGRAGPEEPPTGLGPAGRALWAAILRDLPPGLEFDQRERELLRLAAQTADLAAALEDALASRGTIVPGSRGQDRVHPAVGALVGVRRAQAALLAQLDMTGEGRVSANTRRARKAAEARWAHKRSESR
jgi:hypothetical protein